SAPCRHNTARSRAGAGWAPSRREQRNVLDRRRRGSRLQKRIDLRQVVVRDHLRGKRRHVTGWVPDIRDEARERDRVRSETRALRTALRIVDVAFVAAVLLVKRRTRIHVRIRRYL